MRGLAKHLVGRSIVYTVFFFVYFFIVVYSTSSGASCSLRSSSLAGHLTLAAASRSSPAYQVHFPSAPVQDQTPRHSVAHPSSAEHLAVAPRALAAHRHPRHLHPRATQPRWRQAARSRRQASSRRAPTGLARDAALLSRALAFIIGVRRGVQFTLARRTSCALTRTPLLHLTRMSCGVFPPPPRGESHRSLPVRRRPPASCGASARWLSRAYPGGVVAWG